MLPHEIEPFADHHIEELDYVKLLLDDLDPVIYETHPGLKEMRGKITSAQNALHRFKVCMADEVKQKENYRIKARDCRLHHK